MADLPEAPERETSACFTGHRTLADGDVPVLRARLRKVLEAAWKKGWKHFFNGGALGFDILAAETVLEAQRKHPEITLEMVIPHAYQSDGWPAQDRTRYERVLYLADTRTVLSNTYYQGCYHVRNRYMVDRSSLCLCLFSQLTGGTAYTVAYAASHDVAVVNLALSSSWQSFARTKKSG